MPPVVSIVGKSASGKTTLIERLIPALRARGVRVGTIKHHAHATEFDQDGKDSWRHRRAGAEVVCLAGPRQLVTIRDLAAPLPPDRIAERELADVDLVLTEGFKSADSPKVEVFRADLHQTPLCGPGDRLIALVTDAGIDLGVPKFSPEDAGALAGFLIERFLKEGRG